MATPQLPTTHDQRSSHSGQEREDKKDAFVTVHAAENDSVEPAKALGGAVWQPGFRSRFPWLGVGALCLILVCMASQIIVLVCSDGVSQRRWPELIAPNVVLTGLNNLSTICFGIAIANGIAISWWRKALKGATIEDLHKSWSFSASVTDVICAGRGFNVIALAALTAKLAIIDGMLMQSATTTVLGSTRPIHLSSSRQDAVRGTVAGGFSITGSTFPRSDRAMEMDTPFAHAVQGWDSARYAPGSDSFNDACTGICFLNITTAGFDFDCSEPLPKDVDFSSLPIANTVSANTAGGNSSAISLVNETATMFKIAFQTVYHHYAENYTGERQSSHIQMDLIYTDTTQNSQSGTCPGTTYQQTCIMRPALVKYPATVISAVDTGEKEAVGLASIKQIGKATTTFLLGYPEEAISNEHYWDGDLSWPPSFAGTQLSGFEVVQREQIYEDHSSNSSSNLAGIEFALNRYLGAESTISRGESGYNVHHAGESQQYLPHTHTWSATDCGFFYMEVLQPLISDINTMMFAAFTDPTYLRDALGNGYDGANKAYEARVYEQGIHYKMRWPFMLGAALSTFLCVLCVLPSYWGFWVLGRKVTMGPFEIAHAFRSPMTAQASNGDIDQVIKEVGKQEVQYGHIVSGGARGILGVAEPEYIAAVSSSAKEELRNKVNGRLATVTKSR